MTTPTEGPGYTPPDPNSRRQRQKRLNLLLRSSLRAAGVESGKLGDADLRQRFQAARAIRDLKSNDPVSAQVARIIDGTDTGSADEVKEMCAPFV